MRKNPKATPRLLAAKLSMNRMYLRTALAVVSSATSDPDATEFAGNEAGRLKRDIEDLEGQLRTSASRKGA